MVVLPAPLGPSSPRTVPRGTAKLTTSTATVLPTCLTSLSASLAGWVMLLTRRDRPDRALVVSRRRGGNGSRQRHRCAPVRLCEQAHGKQDVCRVDGQLRGGRHLPATGVVVRQRREHV